MHCSEVVVVTLLAVTPSCLAAMVRRNEASISWHSGDHRVVIVLGGFVAAA